MTSDEYITRVLDYLPHATPKRAQIALELRGHIAERTEAGQTIDDIVRQLGDPAALADSYLSAVPLVPASFAERGAAKVVDLVTVLTLFAPLVWVAWRLGNALVGIPTGLMFVVFAIPLASIAFAGYLVAAEHLTGQTLGKRLFGLRVVRESGARISLGQSFVRQLPQFLQVFWIDILFALFTEHHQRAFELLSRTRVVAEQPEEARQ